MLFRVCTCCSKENNSGTGRYEVVEESEIDTGLNRTVEASYSQLRFPDSKHFRAEICCCMLLRQPEVCEPKMFRFRAQPEYESILEPGIKAKKNLIKKWDLL